MSEEIQPQYLNKWKGNCFYKNRNKQRKVDFREKPETEREGNFQEKYHHFIWLGK